MKYKRLLEDCTNVWALLYLSVHHFILTKSGHQPLPRPNKHVPVVKAIVWFLSLLLSYILQLSCTTKKIPQHEYGGFFQ